MRPIVATAVIVAVTAGLAGALLSGEVAVSAPGPQPVREQNLDEKGFIRVHEQGSPLVFSEQQGAWNVGINGTPTVSPETSPTEPVWVRDVDNPVRNAFQAEVDVGIDPGHSRGFANIDVPAGERLVIEYISGRASSAELEATQVNLSITTDVEGSAGFYQYFLDEKAPGSWVVNEPVRIYATSGPISLVSFRAPDTTSLAFTVTVSGHLVDAA
jgi:hypothetical protein